MKTLSRRSFLGLILATSLSTTLPDLSAQAPKRLAPPPPPEEDILPELPNLLLHPQALYATAPRRPCGLYGVTYRIAEAMILDDRRRGFTASAIDKVSLQVATHSLVISISRALFEARGEISDGHGWNVKGDGIECPYEILLGEPIVTPYPDGWLDFHYTALVVKRWGFNQGVPPRLGDLYLNQAVSLRRGELEIPMRSIKGGFQGMSFDIEVAKLRPVYNDLLTKGKYPDIMICDSVRSLSETMLTPTPTLETYPLAQPWLAAEQQEDEKWFVENKRASMKAWSDFRREQFIQGDMALGFLDYPNMPIEMHKHDPILQKFQGTEVEKYCIVPSPDGHGYSYYVVNLLDSIYNTVRRESTYLGLLVTG